MSRYRLSRYRLRWPTRCAAACAASAALFLYTATAEAGEVVTTTCMHGYGSAHTYHYGDSYADASRSDYGDRYGSGYSNTRPEGFGFRRGFGDGGRGRLVLGSRDANGGGSVAGADAGTGSASNSGTSSGAGGEASSGYGADTCIEVRHELTNPYVIAVRPPQSDAEVRLAQEHDRLWAARCKPTLTQDSRGVERYVYAAPGCDYGRYQ